MRIAGANGHLPSLLAAELQLQQRMTRTWEIIIGYTSGWGTDSALPSATSRERRNQWIVVAPERNADHFNLLR